MVKQDVFVLQCFDRASIASILSGWTLWREKTGIVQPLVRLRGLNPVGEVALSGVVFFFSFFLGSHKVTRNTQPFWALVLVPFSRHTHSATQKG